jgi:hypothetical protein
VYLYFNALPLREVYVILEKVTDVPPSI